MKVKEESEKVGLKLNIQKMKIMESGHLDRVSLFWGPSQRSGEMGWLLELEDGGGA